MNTQGTHKLFSTDYMGFESASVRTYQLQPQGGGIPASMELWVRTRASLGQATCWLPCLELPAGMCYYSPSQPKCQLSRWEALPPPTWDHHPALGQSHVAWQWELAGLFSVHPGEGSRETEREQKWHMSTTDGQSCHAFPQNEMMPPGTRFCACAQLQKTVSPQHVRLPKLN